ncbi:MAG: OmpA family protein [Chlorobi bacterium]|nr:OmpA family protein [Chlorobiota bacterium]
MRGVRLVVFAVIVVSLGGCTATRLGRIAQDSYKIGEYYKAIEKYRKANRKEKDRAKRAEYVYSIAECYRCIGDYERAALYYKNAIRRNYPEPKALLYYAEMLRTSQKYEEALESYRAYLDSVPGNQVALNGIESIRMTQYWMENPTRHIVNAVKELNSRESDYCPVFVAGRDNEIIFTSTRKAATGKKKSMITGQDYADLFRARFAIQRQKWAEPQLLDINLVINTGDEEGAATLSENGEQMLFTRCRYDKSQNLGSEIFTTSQSRGSFSQPVKVELVGDSIIAAHPALSPDGSVLYFVTDKIGGFGGKDIWAAEKSGGSYKNPVNLGPAINTPGDEMFPFVRDNGELYFSSNYHIGMGGLDIFKAVKDEEGNWQVENMGTPVNSPADDFGIAFVQGKNQGMFSSNRKGSRGDDIYSFVVPPKIFQVTGEIYDKETGKKLDGATIRIIGTDGTYLKMRAQDGKFQMKLKPDAEYIFAGFKEGYLNDKARESTIGLKDSKDFRVELYLTSTDAPIKVENINYEFGKWDLLPESITALDTLIQVLTLNPTITIELMSHTDHVGSDQFNFDLSQKRAQVVVDYLISKGINPQRLVAKGYGETWPKKVTRKMAGKYKFLKRNDVLTEDFINKLDTEEQREQARQINRRTEFRVLSTDFHESYEETPEK